MGVLNISGCSDDPAAVGTDTALFSEAMGASTLPHALQYLDGRAITMASMDIISSVQKSSTAWASRLKCLRRMGPPQVVPCAFVKVIGTGLEYAEIDAGETESLFAGSCAKCAWTSPLMVFVPNVLGKSIR
jgi:hypothetical protein